MGVIVNLKKFNETQEINFGETINLILSRKSQNTKRAYMNTYKEFFLYFFNKEFKDCSWEEMKTLNYADILQYIKTMEVRYSYNTIKSRLGALQFLAKELGKIKPNYLNPLIFSIKLNKQKEDTEYGAFSYNEAMDLLEYTKKLNTPTAKIQYLFFKTTLTTAHRVSSLLNLTWNDIKIIKENNIDIPVIYTHDKTDTFQTPIPNELFDEIRDNLFESCMEDKVFQVGQSTLNRTIASFCKKYGIDQKERNLVIHSLKKTSGDIAYSKSGGNIIMVADHLHHKSIQTCYESYLGKNKNFQNKISYNLLSDNDVDNEIDNLVTNLSKEDLILVLKKCDLLTKNNFINQLK